MNMNPTSAILCNKTPSFGGICYGGGQRETTRAEIVGLLGITGKAADHVIESLRHKGWLERASWGEYLLIPAEQGPDALGDSNLLALASRIANPYYIGFSNSR